MDFEKRIVVGKVIVRIGERDVRIIFSIEGRFVMTTKGPRFCFVEATADTSAAGDRNYLGGVVGFCRVEDDSFSPGVSGIG